MQLTLTRKISLSFALIALGGCGNIDPFVEDWNRDRFNAVQAYPLAVNVCFDKDNHSKKQVYDLAMSECKNRIEENEHLIEQANLRTVSSARQAEGNRFQGPVVRQNKINARLETVNPVYLKNDVWNCPILTPNRIVFQCSFNPDANDSQPKRQITPENTVSPDLPPELPVDLKPN